MQSEHPRRGGTMGYALKSQITSKGCPDPESSEENILLMQGVSAIAKSTTTCGRL